MRWVFSHIKNSEFCKIAIETLFSQLASLCTATTHLLIDTDLHGLCASNQKSHSMAIFIKS